MRERLNTRSVLSLLAEAAVGSLGVLGSILCLSTAFSIPFPGLLWPLVPALMLALCALCRVRRSGLIFLGLGAALLLACVLLRKPLLRDARAIWNILVYRYGKGYAAVSKAYDEALGMRFPAASRFLIPVTVLEVFFTALSMSKWKSAVGGVISLLPGIVPCFILTDTPPKVLALGLVAVSALIQIWSQNVRRHEARESGLSLAWAGVVAVVLLGLLMLIFPRRSYRTPITWERLSRKLQELTASWENRTNIFPGPSGDPDEIRLNELEALPDEPTKVMSLDTNYRGRLYLHGTAYAGFDGRSWFKLPEQEWSGDELGPTLTDAQLPDARAGESYYLTVWPMALEEICYFPYNPSFLPEHVEPLSDVCLENRSPGKTYHISFDAKPHGAVENPAYLEFVQTVCRSLPEGMADQLNAWIRNRAKGEPIPRSIPRFASWIADQVSMGKIYSRSAPPSPPDTDFPLWFLNEANSGYCVHFATAAAALLRAYGVPARYVSGYVCEPDENGHFVVTSIQAHAWVEYFYNGNWVVLEPTPGDATEFQTPVTEPTEPVITEPPVEHTRRPTAEPTQVLTEVATETRHQAEPESKPKPENNPPPPPPTTEEEPAVEPQTSKKLPVWLWIVLILLALIGLIVLRRYLALRIWELRLERAQGNQKALLIYRRCSKLNRLAGCSNGDEIDRLGKKAAFSQHELTNDELTALERGLFLAITRVKRTSFLKALYFRFIRAVI